MEKDKEPDELFVIAWKTEHGDQVQWRTEDASEFKRAFDQMRTAFRKKLTVVLGNSAEPAEGCTVLDMSVITSLDAIRIDLKEQRRLAAEKTAVKTAQAFPPMINPPKGNAGAIAPASSPATTAEIPPATTAPAPSGPAPGTDKPAPGTTAAARASGQR